MLLRHAVGAALRRIRLDRGLTLREVAQAARVSMPYLSEIERGRKEPSSEILAGVCAALGLTIVDLLDETRGEIRSADPVLVDLSSRMSGHADADRAVADRAAAPSDGGVRLAA